MGSYRPWALPCKVYPYTEVRETPTKKIRVLPYRQATQSCCNLLRMKSPLTTVTAWIEWKKLCALDLCSQETVSALRSFTKLRFERLLNRYYHETSQAPDNPWHLFETHMTVTQTRQGKCYKDWLFARLEHSSDSDINVLEGGASLIMRDVVREYLRQECTRPKTISLDKTLNNEFSACTLLDLLAAEQDTIDAVCLLEYENRAASHVEKLMPNLTERESIALLAKYMGISLVHPRVLKVAGCKPTAFTQTYLKFVQKVARQIRIKYAGEDTQSMLTLALMVLRQIKSLNFEQKKAKQPRIILFMFQDKEGMKDLNSHEITETELEACI